MFSLLSRIAHFFKPGTEHFRNGLIGEAKLKELERLLGHEFKNERILVDSLVHRSYLPDSDPQLNITISNERKEFLGDAVLSLAVNHHLFRIYPHKSEGELTKMKSIIVSKPILAHYARRIKLGTYILMSDNAYKAGVNETDSVLADTMEAVFGAVFLDGGFEAANRCIAGLLLADLKEIVYNEENINYKSLLQEYIQALHKTFPHYLVRSTRGPEHDKEFKVDVSVKSRVLGSGSGKTKKQAEQEAARVAYKKLLNSPDAPNGVPIDA